MPPTLIVLFVLIALAAGALPVAYWRYRTSAAGAWKRTVLALIRNLQARQTELRDDPAGLKQTLARLADEAFNRHLQTLPVARLADFPNIGPATVGKLEDAGYRRLGDVVSAKFVDIAGIGERRAKDLIVAVRSLVKEARSRFDAGACPEAQEYRRQVDQLRRTEQEHSATRARELAAVTVALKEVFDLLPLARGVTFTGFLLRRGVPGLTAEVFNSPLPTVKDTQPPVPSVIPIPPPAPAAVGVMVAESTPGPFPLPPMPPAPPPPPADLFRAELNGTAKPPESAAEPPGLARMRAVIGLGFVVAKADGKVAQAERKAIRAFLEQSFAHDPVLLRNIDPLMERVEKAVPGEDDALTAVRAAVPVAERPALYQWAERIADASGERNQRERDTLTRIAAGLEVPPESAPRWVAATPESAPLRAAATQSADPRAVLDIAPGITLDADLIRRRFALLTDKLDPAKAAAFGPEFARMAEEKRARVRTAAEALIAPFGEPLEKPATPPPADLRHNPDLDDVFGA